MAHPRPTTPQAPTASTAPSRLRPGRGAARTGAPRRASQGAGLTSLQQKPWWPWLTRGLAGAFFVLVASLIAHQARSVHWPAVWQAVLALPARVLWAGAALALLSHFTYGSFEWIGRHVTGHTLGRATTLGIAMTSYGFTLNLGSVIGGVGVRYRLYSRRGVEPGTIAQVVATSILTNWIGYLLLAAAIPWLWVPPAVFGWSASAAQWRMGGALLALAPLAYLALCLVREGRPLALRVPAGLGVLESVGVALLTMDTLSKTDVLAALLAYRALYYFVPLVLAALALATAELLLHGKKPTK